MLYTIDMTPMERVTELRASRGDTSLRRFEFIFKINGIQFPLTTETAEFIMENGARHTCTIEDGMAILDAFADMTGTAGSFRCKLKLTDREGRVIHSAGFTLNIEEGA